MNSYYRHIVNLSAQQYIRQLEHAPLNRTENGRQIVPHLTQTIELGPMVQTLRGNWEMPYEEVLPIRLVGVQMLEEFESWPKNR